MTPTYWKGLLGTMHKDFFVEELTIENNDGKDITYASGYIINLVPQNKCAVQADGRIMPVNPDQPDSIIAGRRRPLLDHQSRTFTLGRLQQGDGPMPKVCKPRESSFANSPNQFCPQERGMKFEIVVMRGREVFVSAMRALIIK